MGVPQLIGDVQPFAMLRDGPITSVYKGFQRSLDRVVLLKVLKPTFEQDEDLAARFEAEAQFVARIQHPNVVAVYAYGRDDQQAYIATEFVDGQDLSELIADVGALPAELAAYVALQAARGLRAAHAQDVLHRDLKPANLLVAQDGQVKLTDFGMASVASATADEGELRGTPAYMAPELVTGQPPSVEADLFALGATLYEMLTGRRAFTGDTTDAVLDAVLHHDPLPVLDMHADVPERLRAVCARLLVKQPAERYARAEEVVLDLEVFRSESGIRAGEAAMQAFLDDPEAYRSVGAPVLESSHPVREGGEQAQVIEAAPQAPVRREQQPSWGWRWILGAVLVVAVLSAAAFFLAERSASSSRASAPSGRSVVQPGVTLEELFEEPSWPELDSLLAATARQGSTAGSAAQRDADAPADVATVVLTVTPWAEVYVDGASFGVTPLDSLRLTSGAHALVLRNPRFPPYRDSLVVAGGTTDTVSVSLWDNVGRLYIEASPWAVVSINGEVRDTIPPQDVPFIVAPGRTRLRLQHPQLGAWTTTVETRAGSVDTLQFNLQELLGQ